MNSPLSVTSADVIVSNLNRLIRESNMGSMVSVERIIQLLIDSNSFNPHLREHLWRRFEEHAKGTDDNSAEDAKLTLLILKMIVR